MGDGPSGRPYPYLPVRRQAGSRALLLPGNWRSKVPRTAVLGRQCSRVGGRRHAEAGRVGFRLGVRQTIEQHVAKEGIDANAGVHRVARYLAGAGLELAELLGQPRGVQGTLRIVEQLLAELSIAGDPVQELLGK